MDTRKHNESLMEGTGLGLLPGLVVALGLIVFAMAILLTGSMWAVVGVLALIGVTASVIVFIVLALIEEGEAGRRLRAKVPGLGEHTWTTKER
jgi:hypothetical protein